MKFLQGNAMLLSLLLFHTQHLLAQLRDSLMSFGLASSLLSFVLPYWRVFYATFLKPQTTSTSGGQGNALEGFYAGQAEAYDATRRRLLKGREDMLALAAAQLKFRGGQSDLPEARIWVDFGGGTGFNIEAMSAFLDVPSYFTAVYLVDFSSSLCEVARTRFERLGWKNVFVICQDARYFRLPSHGSSASASVYKASLVTFSYSLSMIPDFHSVVDSVPELLAPSGILAVVDFYVQSEADIGGRNYGGGSFDRHVNWLGRAFWRSWFELDRVALEPARRDYLEYRFGTVLSFNKRHYYLGGIPYYTWIGCLKATARHRSTGEASDAPTLDWLDQETSPTPSGTGGLLHAAKSLPLPSSFYQNHPSRLHYDESDPQHTQFGNDYIYAFTWEDPAVDQDILNVSPDDTVLAITSGGDNILSYALNRPRRIHAVDLNPSQNHLLELKVAAFASLPYEDVWKLFGIGKHLQFRKILLEHLSPHLSSQALQFWLSKTNVFTSNFHCGLYETGGSRHAIRLAKYLYTLAGLRNTVRRLCECGTVDEQKHIWHSKLRGVLLNRPLHQVIISSSSFLWKALGVPPAQRDMIVGDYRERVDVKSMNDSRDCGQAIWDFMVETLDPVIENSLLRDENYFYSLCLRGSYTRSCHPAYLSQTSHTFFQHNPLHSSLTIHTSPLSSVLSSILPSSLTIAIIMDSMDWFPPLAPKSAISQIRSLNRALGSKGRVLLRSAASKPWYLKHFQQLGFATERKTHRNKGTEYTDRVNMYKSCWVCVKVAGLPPMTPEMMGREGEEEWEGWPLEGGE